MGQIWCHPLQGPKLLVKTRAAGQPAPFHTRDYKAPASLLNWDPPFPCLLSCHADRCTGQLCEENLQQRLGG